MGVSYALTNYFGTADPGGDLVGLIETRLTAAGWTFVEQVAYTQSSTARYIRVWKNPSTLNVAGADFYIGLCRNQVAGTYFAVRAFESWDATNKLIARPAISSTASHSLPWASIAYGGGTYVLLGNGTHALYSTDNGATWNSTFMPASGNWSVSAYGGGLFVAVIPSTTTAATSTDGITWTQRTLPSNSTWTSLAYGAAATNKWVLMSSAASVAASSVDGLTWTARTGPGTSGVKTVAYGTNGFVTTISGSNNAFTSTDGATWASNTNALPGSVQTWNNMAANGTNYVAMASGYGSAATGTGTGTWTARSISGGTTYTLAAGALKYSGSLFVAITTDATAALTSPDGVTWTARTLPALPSGGTYNGVANNGTAFIASILVAAGTNQTATSTDGSSWISASAKIPKPAALGLFAPNNTQALAMTEPLASLATSTNYDIGILASNSYLMVGVNLNGLTTALFHVFAGLYQPAYSEEQTTNPPLSTVMFNSSNYSGSGVSRAFRAPAETFTYAVSAGADAIILGTFQGGVEPVSQTIRASKVALAGGNPSANFVANGGFRGWLYDCVCVGTSGVDTMRIGDTVTIGTTVYTCLAQGPNSFNVAYLGYFWNTAAGT